MTNCDPLPLHLIVHVFSDLFSHRFRSCLVSFVHVVCSVPLSYRTVCQGLLSCFVCFCLCDHKSTELLGEHSSTDELVPKLRRFPLFLPLDDKTGPVLRELVRQGKAERG